MDRVSNQIVLLQREIDAWNRKRMDIINASMRAYKDIKWHKGEITTYGYLKSQASSDGRTITIAFFGYPNKRLEIIFCGSYTKEESCKSNKITLIKIDIINIMV